MVFDYWRLTSVFAGGLMAELDETWLWAPSPSSEACAPKTAPGTYFRLGLENLEGIFLLVVAGVLTGVVLSVAEIVYHR